MAHGSQAFLDAHPALVSARAVSSIWPQILKEASLELGDASVFVVGGDTIGDEADLYLDRLARGARGDGSDTLSRQLFLELSPDLQTIVQRGLLKRG